MPSRQWSVHLWHKCSFAETDRRRANMYEPNAKGLIFQDMSKLSFPINSATGSCWVNEHKTNERITVRDVTSDFATFEELHSRQIPRKFRHFMHSCSRLEGILGNYQNL